MATSPKYKLTYFDFRARAELSRLLFAYAGVDYEDIRIDFNDWPDYRSKTLYGFLPTLEIDQQHTLAQSKTIARYLAEVFGLSGKSAVDRAKANMFVEVIHDDIFMKGEEIYHEGDLSKKEILKQKNLQPVEKLFSTLQNQLKVNGGRFFVGDEITWADLAVADGLDIPGAFGIALDKDNFPLLNAHQESIYGLPRIADWLKKRPINQL